MGPGGRQPVMKDTVFDRKVQKLVNDSGIPMGMKLDTLGMNGDECRKNEREVLGSHEEFQSVKTLVEELVESRSNIIIMFGFP